MDSRILRVALGVLLAGVLAVLVVGFGYVRTMVAGLMGAAILWLGFSYFRSAGEVPPEPDVADVSGSGFRYVCSTCGLELRVEVASTDKAPTHCREPMILVRDGDPPPLRPV